MQTNAGMLFKQIDSRGQQCVMTCQRKITHRQVRGTERDASPLLTTEIVEEVSNPTFGLIKGNGAELN